MPRSSCSAASRVRRAGTVDVSEPLDRDLLAMLAQLIAETTQAFDNYDYARALERTESFFWSFCDNYVELVKIRAYGDARPTIRRVRRARRCR
jgi:valyl-tRNA synthetase